MSFLLALLVSAAGADAATLACDVTNVAGPYRGGRLILEEEAELKLRWRGPAGEEKIFLGGRHLCGIDASSRPEPFRCTHRFTQPTPLRKLVSLCKTAGETGVPRWAGSVIMTFSPAFEDGRLQCRTALGAYADFDLNLANCR
jgi:hypothetical protein